MRSREPYDESPVSFAWLADEAGEDWRLPSFIIDAIPGFTFREFGAYRRARISERLRAFPERRPDFVYKYRSLATNEDLSRVVALIRESALYFASPKALNDAREFHITLDRTHLDIGNNLDGFWKQSRLLLRTLEFEEDEIHNIFAPVDLREGVSIHWDRICRFAESRLQIIKNEFGVCSFSDDPLIPSTWGLYADSSRGVALQFATKSEFWNGLRQVQYTDEAPRTSSAALNLQSEILRACTTKHSSWKSEREWRIIDEPGFHSFPAEELTGVIFGVNASQETKSSISSACSSRNPSPRLYQAHNNAGYGIVLKEFELKL